MHDTGTQEISFGGIFDQLEDDERISVRAGDFKVFLAKALSGVGISEPSLAFSYRGIEQEAAVSLERVVEKAAASLGKHLANGVDDEVICDITWWREDVLKACQHVYGIVLSRDDDGVEDTIDGVLAEIGDGLQDRSTEFGYELIYEYLPEREKVMKLAKRFDDAALAAAADRLIRERWGDGYEILLDDGTVGDEPAFYVAAPRDESEGGSLRPAHCRFYRIRERLRRRRLRSLLCCHQCHERGQCACGERESARGGSNRGRRRGARSGERERRRRVR